MAVADPAPMSDRGAVNLMAYHYQGASPWRGFGMDKSATDLLVYQEIITGLRPDIILETGVWHGGSALFFADLCEALGHGYVLGVDIALPEPAPEHPRLTLVQGNSACPLTVRCVHALAAGRRGLVILDSDHARPHVLAELDAYHDLVMPGGYLIVEDTYAGGVDSPGAAVREWLARPRDGEPPFAVDPDVEPYLTFAPGGYLHRME